MLLLLAVVEVTMAAVRGGSEGSGIAVVETGGLTVSVDMATGSYTLSVAATSPRGGSHNGAAAVVWLRSAPPTYAGHPLVLSTSTKVDAAGGNTATLRWSLESSGASSAAVLATTISASPPSSTSSTPEPEQLLFTQTWLVGIKNTTADFNGTAPSARVGIALGAFPSWVVPAPAGTPLGAPSSDTEGTRAPDHLDLDADLNMFTINGCQLQYAGFSKWSNAHAAGGQQSMPLVWYNREGRAVAQGPAADFFVAVHQSTSAPAPAPAPAPARPAADDASAAGAAVAVIAAGPMASLDSIADGYHYTTIITASSGVQGAMEAYGAALLTRSQKTPVAVASGGSFVLAHLGYWVDNGAAYYRYYPSAYAQSTGMDACVAANNCTREDALLAVKADAAARRIPLRYYQWDDWAPLNWDW